MSTCGEKYASLVTANGYDASNPTGYKPWASEADVEAWLATAERLFWMQRDR